MRKLYEKIQYHCKQNEIRIRALCSGTGISLAVMTNLARSRKDKLPEAKTERIASYLGITVDCLYGKVSGPETGVFDKLRRACEKSGTDFCILLTRCGCTYEEIRAYYKGDLWVVYEKLSAVASLSELDLQIISGKN